MEQIIAPTCIDILKLCTTHALIFYFVQFASLLNGNENVKEIYFIKGMFKNKCQINSS